MGKTKVAVIGLGHVAQLVHLPNLLKINDAEVTAVSEPNKSRLNAVADKFNIPDRFKNYKELLNESDAEAVIIATPTGLHQQVANDSLKAKKDVLVEKPIARSFEEAKSIVDTAAKKKQKLMVGMNLRYRPDLMLFRTLINAGEIGEPFYIRCNWIRRQSSTENWFSKKNEAGGGVILDLGMPLLDIALWLLDYPSVKSVSTQNYYQHTKNLEDTSVSFIRCDGSEVIHLEASWSLAIEKDLFSITIFGSKGSLATNPLKLYKRIGEEYIDLKPTFTENSSTLLKKSYFNELKSFIGAVRGINPVYSSGEEALQRMKIIGTMYKSAEKNQELKID
jgi:predicted dehydrogenase